jgi:amino acid permease
MATVTAASPPEYEMDKERGLTAEEKGAGGEVPDIQGHQLKQGLHNRHMQMIAIGTFHVLEGMSTIDNER